MQRTDCHLRSKTSLLYINAQICSLKDLKEKYINVLGNSFKLCKVAIIDCNKRIYPANVQNYY